MSLFFPFCLQAHALHILFFFPFFVNQILGASDMHRVVFFIVVIVRSFLHIQFLIHLDKTFWKPLVHPKLMKKEEKKN